ncbi:hypothetical protein YC2023_061687 [Brassica napus]
MSVRSEELQRLKERQRKLNENKLQLAEMKRLLAEEKKILAEKKRKLNQRESHRDALNAKTRAENQAASIIFSDDGGVRFQLLTRVFCVSGEARNVKKGGDLMGVDIVLLDDPHCCKGAPASHFQTPSERGRHLGDQWLSCWKNYHPLQAVRFNRCPLKQPMAGSTFHAQNVLGSFSVAYLDSHVHHKGIYIMFVAKQVAGVGDPLELPPFT